MLYVQLVYKAFWNVSLVGFVTKICKQRKYVTAAFCSNNILFH